jgi:hypothetical protein
MKQETGRSFGIADGLLLVLACAAGLAATRAALPPDLAPSRLWDDLIGSLARAGDPLAAAGVLAEFASILPVPFLAAWSPACLAMQLRQPRDRWRRRLRGPGLMACLAASAAVAGFVASAPAWAGLGSSNVSDQSNRIFKACVLGSLVAGLGVLCCWATMTACGVMRPRRHWADRLGRLTGACWIVVGTAGFLTVLLGWN